MMLYKVRRIRIWLKVRLERKKSGIATGVIKIQTKGLKEKTKNVRNYIRIC